MKRQTTSTPSKFLPRSNSGNNQQQNTSFSVRKERGTHVDLSDKEITSLDLSFLGSSSSSVSTNNTSNSGNPYWTAKERAALEMVSSLDVSRNNLREIPRELSITLPRLLEINASRNLLCESSSSSSSNHNNNMNINHTLSSPSPSAVRGQFLSGADSVFSSSLCFPRGLTRLDVSHNQLSSIADLVVLTRLQYLDVSYNRIMSFGICRRIVHPFPELVELKLSNNWVKSLRGLECIPSLELVDARSNSISFTEDVAPLQKLPNLKYCLLEGNPLLANASNKIGQMNTQQKNQQQEDKIFASTQTSDADEEDDDDEGTEQESESTASDREQDVSESESEEIPSNQQQNRRPVAISPIATTTTPSKKPLPKFTTSRTTAATASSSSVPKRSGSSTSHGGIISSYASQLQQKRQSHQDPTSASSANITNISSVTASTNATNTTTSSSEHNAIGDDATTHPNNSSATSGSNFNNTLILLDFERKSNQHLRQELEQIKQLLRNTRSAISSGTNSSRSMKQENEKLKKQIVELEQQAAKDKIERNALKRRSDERLTRLENEHKRVVAAQEEEIQELRLELDAATAMLSHYENNNNTKLAKSQPATTRNSVSNNKSVSPVSSASARSSSPGAVMSMNVNKKNHKQLHRDRSEFEDDDVVEPSLSPYPSPSNEKKSANKFASQLKEWISSEVQ